MLIIRLYKREIVKERNTLELIKIILYHIIY